MSTLLPLRDYQVDAIKDLHTRWDAGDTRVPMVLATGLGKGHPLDTEVPTPDGFRRWGDLVAGDRIYGSDGCVTTVMEVFDRGTLPTYRVMFSDGASVEVDEEHLWEVRDSAQSYRPWGITETRELLKHELKRARGWRFHIPMTGVVNSRRANLPLDPYVVGALISNGCMTGRGTQLTTPDVEVARLISVVTMVNKIKDADESICDRYSLPGLAQVTRDLGMRVGSKEKRIPESYLLGNAEQRIGLLHGLMDGDGAARDESRRSVSYFTSSLGLAQDVSQLVASLGGTGIVKTYDRGEKGIEYAVRILLPTRISPFRTARKSHAGTETLRNLQPKRAIVSIERVADKPIRCIMVDAEDHLYLITRQYIVTHNTVIFAHLIADWVRSNVAKRVLVLVHTDELVQQAYKKIKDVAPGLHVGIVKAERNEVTARVIVASVQSLRSAKRREQIRNVGMIIVDECHHATATTYRTILEHFGAFNTERFQIGFDDKVYSAAPLVAGFTATLARGDKQKLSDVWQECTFQRGIAFGIRRGYLLDVRGKRIVIPDLDLTTVKKSGGDYQDGALGDAMDAALAPSVIASAYLEHASDRKGLAFWPLVATAQHGADAFNEVGIPSAIVHGGTPREERRLILKKLHTGEIQVVHNCGVLTEGFDEPTVSCVVNARPTQSAPLYQQMVGRGLRPDLSLPPDSRGDCLVLDVVGVSRTHNLRTLIDLSSREVDDASEDLSLLEIEDMLDAAEAAERDEETGEEPPEYYGAVAAEDFDPLARTGIGAWLKTAGGTFFLPIGKEAYVLIVESEDPGQYDVAWLTQSGRAFYHMYCPGQGPYLTASQVCACGQGHVGAQGDLTEHRGLSLDMACSWAEEVLEELGGSTALLLAGTKKAWRRDKEASEPQKALAARLGIELTGQERKGDVADLISTVKGSQRIDPVVAFMQASRG